MGDSRRYAKNAAPKMRSTGAARARSLCCDVRPRRSGVPGGNPRGGSLLDPQRKRAKCLEVIMKRTCWVTATVASIAALALSGAFEPVAAQKGGHGGAGGGGAGGGGGGGGGGGAGFGGGRAGGASVGSGVAGGGSIRSGGRAFSGSGPRASVNGGHISGGDGRHVRHFRRGRAFGYAPYGYYDDTYAYGGCGYYYRRAVATGSSYWWNRYYDCVGD
jgi:hypothetical protein